MQFKSIYQIRIIYVISIILSKLQTRKDLQWLLYELQSNVKYVNCCTVDKSVSVLKEFRIFYCFNIIILTWVKLSFKIVRTTYLHKFWSSFIYNRNLNNNSKFYKTVFHRTYNVLYGFLSCSCSSINYFSVKK